MQEVLLIERQKKRLQGSENFSATAEMMWETCKYYNDGSQ